MDAALFGGSNSSCTQPAACTPVHKPEDSEVPARPALTSTVDLVRQSRGLEGRSATRSQVFSFPVILGRHRDAHAELTAARGPSTGKNCAAVLNVNQREMHRLESGVATL